MSVKDKFDYYHLPRDGHTLFLQDTPECREQFLQMASDAAYVLVPAPYTDLLAKWIGETNLIRPALMNNINMKGGFCATVNSVEVFTDAFATKDKQYPAGSPALFGQWGGQFTRELELERSPYYRLRHTWPEHQTVNYTVWTRMAFTNTSHVHRCGVDFDCEIDCILLPHRFLQDFLTDESLRKDYVRREAGSDIEQNFNGLIGHYRGIPIHTDAHLHPKMVNKDDPIKWIIKKNCR